MRSGLFPSQQRALRQAFKKADKFDHFRQRTRRAFFAGGALAVACAVAAFWAGVRLGRVAETQEPRAATPAWMNELALGPVEALRQQAIHLLTAVSGKPADDVLWLGFHRLVRVYVSNPSEEALRRMLLQVASRPDAPPAARETIADLQPR
jgi:hypothetical protein